jgi:YidC/Oxa1 family membrane protein insertase
MSRETMELYRTHGTNPFSSCLPILAQSPIFFALFRVLNSLVPLSNGEYTRPSIGPIDMTVAEHAANATIFGAPISSYFLEPNATMATRVVTVLLIIAMSVTTFTTQRQLTRKNMPASALEGPMAQQQKMLLYVLPLVFAISGVNFPIGVLIYWTTTNIWTMGQQFYVIRRNPTPGSEAERQLKERRQRKAAAKGVTLEEEETSEPEKPKGQRQQPKRSSRADRGTKAGKPEAASGSSAGSRGSGKRPLKGPGSATAKPADESSTKPESDASTEPSTPNAKKRQRKKNPPTTGSTDD